MNVETARFVALSAIATEPIAEAYAATADVTWGDAEHTLVAPGWLAENS
jgi:hypothetical protein